ncbi:hypothetical protein K501DRAFT_174224 [Backusella circina FSU 941]|nr:hypothetical protein K501DRAFT_174224 [Backusella circina FSU 941]
MVQDAVLTAQFVQALPVMISNSLSITADDVIVVTIASAQSTSKRRKRDSTTSGVLVSIAVPGDDVDTLQNMVSQKDSSLYSSNNGQLALLIDSSYFVKSNVAQTSSGSSQSVSDPNGNSSGNSSNGGSSGGLSKGALIGICVSVGVVVYAAATVGVIHVYRRRRNEKQERAIAEHQVFAQSISSPILQENSLGWANNTQQPQQQNSYHAHQW